MDLGLSIRRRERIRTLPDYIRIRARNPTEGEAAYVRTIILNVGLTIAVSVNVLRIADLRLTAAREADAL